MERIIGGWQFWQYLVASGPVASHTAATVTSTHHRHLTVVF